MNTIHIYTDGACSGNPGKGGYGAVLLCGSHRKELSGAFRMTTNNRMELMAAIAALEAIRREGSRVILTSDSRYLVDAFKQGWISKWKRRSFTGIKNADLWERLTSLVERHNVTFEWVKGHAGNELNERCDALAVGAYNGKDLPDDPGFACAGKEEKDRSAAGPEGLLAEEFGRDLSERVLSFLEKNSLAILPKPF